MGKKTDPAANGQAAGKNGQELGLENEARLLDCIVAQGWVREREAALLTGMSDYTVGIVGRRLAKKKGWICRERKHGNAGHFLWLSEAGANEMGVKFDKDIKIPPTWRHDAMAIQTLHYLAQVHQCAFITETVMRRGGRTGKFPDGKLVHGNRRFFFEQENTRKTGALLRSQTETVTRLANDDYTCFVAYPFPAAVLPGHTDHETSQTNSLRRKWGSPSAPTIKLVRCIFDSRLAYLNMRVSRFEILDLPGMVDTAASRKPQPGVTDQVRGFKWKTRGVSVPGMPQITEATLTHNGVIKFHGTFKDSRDLDVLPMVLELDGGWLEDECRDENVSFFDFIRANQKRIEKEIADEMRSESSPQVK